jgi:hypothetical protein
MRISVGVIIRALNVCLLALSVGCGGGVEDDIKEALNIDPPRVNVTGNAGVYWDDQEIDIRFAVRNMDTSTVNYTIQELENIDGFVFDNIAGTLRAEFGELTPHGDYSFTINASDGSGKSASKAFQFRVDHSIAGSYVVSDPVRADMNMFGPGLNVFFTRDGQVGVSSGHAANDAYVNGEWEGYSIECLGSYAIHGADFEGTMSCGGFLPRFQGSVWGYTGFEEISKVDFVGNELTISLDFYDSLGGSIQTWSSANLDLYSQSQWPSNPDLVGTYVPIGASYQYRSSARPGQPPSPQDLLVNTYWEDELFVNPLDKPQIIISETFELSSETSSNGNSVCDLAGQISQTSLDEFAIVNGAKGAIESDRWMNIEYSAVGCDGWGELSKTLSFNQGSGPAVLSPSFTFENPGDNLTLYIVGAGEDRPFAIMFRQICDRDGSPTQYNINNYNLSCY